MPSRCSLFLCLFVSLMSDAIPSIAVAQVKSSQDIWYSVYFSGRHSGYSHIVSVPDVYQNDPARRDDSSTVTKITVFGTAVEQDVESKSWSDPKTGEPFFQSFKITSGGVETDVDATFSPTSVTAVLKSGTDFTTKNVPIPPGEKIVDGDSEGMDSDEPLKLGQVETDLEFDPLTLSLEKQVSTVVAVGIPVVDAINGASEDTAKITVVDPEGTATAFQNESGIPIRILMSIGVTLLRSTPEDAISTNDALSEYAGDPSSPSSGSATQYRPSQDLAVNTAVTPGGKSMGDERTLTELTVKLSVTGEPSKVLSEEAVAVPPAKTDPIALLATPATMPFLTDAPYLSLGSQQVKSTAQQIVNKETDTYKIVRSIHDWVYGHMTPEGSLGVPRSAGQIISDPVGVCRDYAILYTSLARAAGVPTKIEAGLVGYHGKFYYHAWASSYVGAEVGWLPVDATMPGMFVDASHIALGSGDPTVMFTLADVIGNSHVETLKARNSL